MLQYTASQLYKEFARNWSRGGLDHLFTELINQVLFGSGRRQTLSCRHCRSQSLKASSSLRMR